jgi:pyrroline-5-carboxylate reductase
MKVGFAGTGNMATAMARGWATGDGGPEAMLFCDLEAERARALAEEVGGQTRPGLRALAGDSDVLVLAVKPAALDEVATELGGQAPALISVLAGTPTERIAESFPGVPAIRVMPNQPVEALARGGEREGLEPGLAGELVAGALAGTAELLLKRDPATIRNAVASPGGATEAGLAHLEGVVEDAFENAVNASLERVR